MNTLLWKLLIFLGILQENGFKNVSYRYESCFNTLHCICKPSNSKPFYRKFLELTNNKGITTHYLLVTSSWTNFVLFYVVLTNADTFFFPYFHHVFWNIHVGSLCWSWYRREKIFFHLTFRYYKSQYWHWFNDSITVIGYKTISETGRHFVVFCQKLEQSGTRGKICFILKYIT